MSSRARSQITASLLVVAAGFAVFTNTPGAYIADTRFEQYWGSWQYFIRQAWIWDNVRGLGRPIPFYSPVVGFYVSVLQFLNLTPATSERILHGTYLVIAGLGIVQALRLFRPVVRFEHLLAALVYMFSPFAAQFLVPSGLFLHYAIAPWLLTAFVLGVRGPERWRWAALFALIVFTVGGLNAPTLAYAALPILPAALYLVFIERSTTLRMLLGYVARAAALTLLISSATLVYLRSNLGGFTQNLTTTELPSTVGRHSSWAETSARAWQLAHLSPNVHGASHTAGDLVLHQWSGDRGHVCDPGARALDRLAVVVASAPHVWRHDAALARFSWWGFTLRRISRGSARCSTLPSTTACSFARSRDTYKAGAGLGIGVSVLVGVGVADGIRWLGRRRSTARQWIALTGVVGVLVIVAIASFPFWTDHLYSPTDRVTQIPQYWTSALSWLNRQPGDNRVLILPGTTAYAVPMGLCG